MSGTDSTPLLPIPPFQFDNAAILPIDGSEYIADPFL